MADDEEGKLSKLYPISKMMALASCVSCVPCVCCFLRISREAAGCQTAEAFGDGVGGSTCDNSHHRISTTVSRQIHIEKRTNIKVKVNGINKWRNFYPTW